MHSNGGSNQEKSWIGECTYKEKTKETRRQVAVAKKHTRETWSKNLNTAEGRQKMI